MSAGAEDVAFETVLSGCRRSHARLLETVSRLGPGGTGAPSRLPQWTVGHLLTHLARNADSHTGMLRAAMAGDAVEQYAGGHEQRAADIEAGAGRDEDDIVADVRRSVADLEAAFDAMSPRAWDGHGLSMGRIWPCRQIVFHRWREVELHLVDLGLGDEPADWPEEYVSVELPVALAQLPARLDAVSRARLFAWLVGRGPMPADLDPAPWQSTSYSRGGPFAAPG
ncbi:MAG: maleylpyruvate isomerase N-terminal domain-containing protein [Acidimicrobiales bacterium]